MIYKVPLAQVHGELDVEESQRRLGGGGGEVSQGIRAPECDALRLRDLEHMFCMLEPQAGFPEPLGWKRLKHQNPQNELISLKKVAAPSLGHQSSSRSPLRRVQNGHWGFPKRLKLEAFEQYPFTSPPRQMEVG